MSESLKHKTVKGTLWSAAERFSVQIVTFVVMIVMANLLTPADYGLVGMLAIFIAVSQSLVDSGFSQALIRKQNRTELDNSTVFYFNVIVGIILYLILFSIAPLIADFYSEPILTPLMRLISLSVVINSFIVVQRALLTVNIDFKTQAKASVVASILSGVIGIYLAYAGCGVWSIVWYQIANLGINCIMLWIMTSWRPKWMFSWQIFKEMFGFGSKLALSGILNTLYNNILLAIVGKMYSAADLGYYTRAHQFADFPSATGTSIMQKVTYPVLCTLQQDNERLKIIYRKFLRLSAYIIFPAMIGLAALSKPFISVFLNEQWAFTAELLPIICFSMMWYPIHAINLNLLQVKGKTGIILKLEVIKKIVGVITIACTIWSGLIILCWGMVINSIFALIINTHYTGKYIGINFWMQMRDIIPILLLSLSMGIVAYVVSYCLDSSILELIAGSVVGIIYYIGISKVMSFHELSELFLLIKNKE